MSFDSINSKPIHFFDVPEIKSLKTSFAYNFFASNESIDESGSEAINGNLSKRFLRKGTVDTQNLNSRTPRYVKLEFAIGDTKKKMMSQKGSKTALTATLKEVLAALNKGQIITEDDIAVLRYNTETIGNSSLDVDLQNFMRIVLNKYMPDESSVQDAIISFSQTTGVSSDFISKKMVPPSLNARPQGQQFSDFATDEKKIKASAHFNVSYAPFMMRRAIESGNVLEMSELLSRYSQAVAGYKDSTDLMVTEDEDVFDLPAVSAEKANGTFVPEGNVVGVMFQKYRVFNGKKYPMPAVFSIGDSPTFAYDSKVAYGQTYEYIASTLAKFKIPVTTIDGRQYSQIIFVASKPSAPVQVTITEDRSPEPPQDINYRYEYDSESLYITWSPPVNPQRDVKYFQVFRRSTVDEPFELIAHLDFDDSAVRTSLQEDIDESLILSYSYMPTYFIDNDFDRDSSYIYALVSVDARQNSSLYSTQVRVSFDTQRNKVKKELVSYAGAPKQYPNWMLKENFFVDSMKDSSHSQVHIYFNPEAYTVVRGSGETFPAFYSTTIDPLSKYVFQFINTDRLLERKFEVKIDDTNFKEDQSASAGSGEDKQ